MDQISLKKVTIPLVPGAGNKLKKKWNFPMVAR
jgi:hypothetical protein